MAQVPVGSGHKYFISEAHSSPVLQAGVADLPGKSTSLQFTHRGKFGHILPFHIFSCETKLFQSIK